MICSNEAKKMRNEKNIITLTWNSKLNLNFTGC